MKGIRKNKTSPETADTNEVRNAPTLNVLLWSQRQNTFSYVNILYRGFGSFDYLKDMFL